MAKSGYNTCKGVLVKRRILNELRKNEERITFFVRDPLCGWAMGSPLRGRPPSRLLCKRYPHRGVCSAWGQAAASLAACPRQPPVVERSNTATLMTNKPRTLSGRGLFIKGRQWESKEIIYFNKLIYNRLKK